VAVDDQCLDAFQELKLKKKYKYIVYKVSEDSSMIVVEKVAEEGSYDDFIAALPTEECRYAIFDFEYEKPGEGQRHKICFYAWYTCLVPSLSLPHHSPLGLRILQKSNQKWCMLLAKMRCARN